MIAEKHLRFREMRAATTSSEGDVTCVHTKKKMADVFANWMAGAMADSSDDELCVSGLGLS